MGLQVVLFTDAALLKACGCPVNNIRQVNKMRYLGVINPCNHQHYVVVVDDETAYVCIG